MPTMTSGRRSLIRKRRTRAKHRELFRGHGKELQRQHREVEHHAPADLEQRRVRIPVNHHVPDVPGQAEIEHQAHHNSDVAEEGGQDGGPNDGVIFFQTENVDRRR